MNEDQPNFKVTDRRLFNADGSLRDVPAEEKPEPKPESTPEPKATAPEVVAAPQTGSKPEPEVQATQIGRASCRERVQTAPSAPGRVTKSSRAEHTTVSDNAELQGE